MRKLDRAPLAVTAVHDQPIPMRDGTILRADVHRPAEGEPVPTLLVRNPYGEGLGRAMPVVPALEAGFAVVIQHCRGRGTSDGMFEPWADEPSDGADTVRWVTAQPWSNELVVGWGISYVAGTALQTAIERPEGYVGIVAAQTPADFYDDLTYIGGALALGSAQGWAAMQGLLGGQHAMLAGEDAGSLLGAALPAMFDPDAARSALPLRDALGLPGASPFWADWLDHPSRDEYWTKFGTPRDNYAAIDVPVYHVASWYDLFLSGTLENHAALGGPLVIGPWTHGGLHANGAGEAYFGPGSPAMILQLEADQLGFLREVVTDGEPNPARPPVKIFVMGENVWRDEQEWPLARTVFTPWYLRAGGSLGPATSTGTSTFVSDPRDPVPTVGGSLLFPEFNTAGPHDQRVLDGRTDILRFVSPPLDADLEVTGPLTVVLYAATDAADTDWTAKLIDVHPDGTALNVADGIVRARYRNGVDAPDPITPGTPYEYRIDLVATSQVFKAGHSIRVDVASSNFPRFDRNPGNGKLSAEATEADLTMQHQTVFHDAERASHILLPVIPR
ncbi:CocE/NonD family hydrolase [Cryptosporangium minutisporangium]|uniref:CocE/NonD family hydrolase n=1 Tax=Cryptosporangium minutisporangium TaxID=113569 RepID=A0ABP6SUC4_9ACTN